MRIIHLFFQSFSRFCISAVFLAGGIRNLLQWYETEKSLIGAFLDWQSYVYFSHDMQIFFSMLIAWTPVLQVVATTFLLAGGILLLLGKREKLAACLLILFLIPATLLYHPFWWIDGVGSELQGIMFLKNLAILGFLLQTLSQKSSRQSLEKSHLYR